MQLYTAHIVEDALRRVSSSSFVSHFIHLTNHTVIMCFNVQINCPGHNKEFHKKRLLPKSAK